MSFTHDLHDQFAVAAAIVEIEKDHLLPGAQCQLARHERNGDVRPDQRRSQMGMAVAVMPGAVMLVRHARRNESFQKLRQVGQKSRLIFDSGQSPGGTGHKHGHRAGGKAAGFHLFADIIRDVADVAIPVGREPDAPCDHHYDK